MRRMIKVLAMVTLVAVMLVASVSPAIAKVVRGGVLVQPTTPCVQNKEFAQNVPGSHLRIFPPKNPERRTPGCWVVLPHSDS